ncbi:nucleotidyl transferase AbiEii/AbiGii toxin family protein [Kineosporia sp. R_H_3]|uniref:nucleotidyl transferase AbiEii/AbiGii toxin family protein n=1 Tax=Kineosporia sp. R_H_3 TaxID=1961848 RepID=UPI000B4B0CC2|nr:nucleotidyl transferase AbiEii/AbiGii toxin family protein [Kineosporia sp. R_H_3]
MSRPTRAHAGGQAYLDLQNRARRQGRPTQELLVLYALERFLARLAASPHASAFVLKGGMLLAAFDARRPTVDADLLATGFPNDEDAALSRIREVAGTEPADDDGVIFLPQTARARVIREENLYSGVRVTMQASIATATVKVQLDINFGDPVTPGPQLIEYPTLREEHPPVRILGYPMATVIAEKVCTAIDLGDTSTRVRDYADIWILTRRHDLDAADLRNALAATARHRGVELRRLSDAIGDLAALRADVYTAFLSRIDDDALDLPTDLAELLDDLIAFADPLLSDEPAGVWSAPARAWHGTST